MKNKYLKNVCTLEVDSDKCVGCGRCIEVCPHKVFNLNKGKVELINKDSCMECGACAKNCSFNAIEVKSGVGCAYAVIMGWLLGTEPTCDCSSDNSNGCC
ncbi:mercury methylation ferredoxin HgcB [Clostridium sp. BJN0013]|uniref:mercury methylation ferredoxin HgcB n=1 Tax=Clostridium sp. BJN0013 TaxID=3236840 RepID=UPI0034C63D31